MDIQYQIRLAELNDVAHISEVNIQSWKETYPGIMPDEKIAGLTKESCIKNWVNALSQGSVILVAIVDGIIVGFVAGGENLEKSFCKTGLGNECECELSAMYILQRYHKMGIGKGLFGNFVLLMQRFKHTSMVVWVAEKNPATGFYARMDGEIVDNKDLIVCDIPVPIVAYRFFI